MIIIKIYEQTSGWWNSLLYGYFCFTDKSTADLCITEAPIGSDFKQESWIKTHLKEMRSCAAFGVVITPNLDSCQDGNICCFSLRILSSPCCNCNPLCFAFQSDERQGKKGTMMLLVSLSLYELNTKDEKLHGGRKKDLFIYKSLEEGLKNQWIYSVSIHNSIVNSESIDTFLVSVKGISQTERGSRWPTAGRCTVSETDISVWKRSCSFITVIKWCRWVASAD